jgi:ABC-type multidrug transport system fused ATPase/permease subunit
MSKPKSKVTLAYVLKTIVLPRWKLLSIGLILVLVRSVAGLVPPFVSKPFVDNILNAGNGIPQPEHGPNGLFQSLLSHAAFENLSQILLWVSFAILIQAVTSYTLTQILSVEAQHLISVLRSKVQRHLLKLPTRFFDNQKSGALVSRVMTDVEGVRNLVGTGLVQLVGGTATAIISIVFLVSISPWMTLFILLPMAIFGVITLKAFGYIRPIFRERGKLNAEVTGRLTETLNGIRVIKGFNAEEQEIKIFESGVEKLFLNVKKSLTSTSFVTSAGTFLVGMASVGIMGLSGYFKLGPGDFTSFTMFMVFMIAPIVQMSNIGSQLTEAFAGLDRTEELLNIQPEDDGTVRKTTIGKINGEITYHNVSFEYEEGKPVLNGVSFTAPPGSVTALVGTSGSGKTTIAGLVASYLNPTGGTITVDNIDLSTVSLDSYRSQLGVVLQDDFLFEGTIRENIMYPRPKAAEAQVLQAVKAAHVDEFTDRFEKGLDTLIGERGVKLSGGQRQRIAIARAILADPRILILDEATSNLDTESEAFIQESLRELMQGRTTFVIAHRLSTIRRADQILVIEKGHIVERGRHEELIEKKGRYFELYTYQARI